MGQENHTDVVRLILEKHSNTEGALLPILHDVQDTLGFIPNEAIDQIGKGVNRSRAEVHGVVSFYHHFRTKKPGAHVIQVCRSEACQSMGGEETIAEFKRQLDIDFHETSTDDRITLEAVYCLGHCACAPAVMVDGVPRAKVKTSDVSDLLSDLGAMK